MYNDTMKKFTLTALLLLFTTLANAATLVTVVWPFGPASTSNYVRHLIERANSNQTKYNFILLDKPGAGGAIAAAHAKNMSKNDQLAILATSSSYFLRPFLYDNSGYTFDDFQTVRPIAEVPSALIAKEGKTFKGIMSKPNASIGTLPAGTVYNVMAESLKSVKPNLVIATYNSPADVTRDVLSGTVDMGLDFLSSASANNMLTVLGVTGSNKIPGHVLVKDLGAKDFENLDLKFFMLTPTTTSPAVTQEFIQIFAEAAKYNPNLDNSYKFDYATPIKIAPAEYKKWYDRQIEINKKFTANLKIN